MRTLCLGHANEIGVFLFRLYLCSIAKGLQRPKLMYILSLSSP